MKKKLVTLLLALCCACGVSTFTACRNLFDDSIRYKLSGDKTYYIVTDYITPKIRMFTNKNIVIPATHNNLPVKVIENSAFEDCSSLTSVTIPDSVTSIGDYAFSGCTALTEIHFNATEMNDLDYYNNVFSNAGENGEGIVVTIGANVKKIPAYLFYSLVSSAPKLTSVVFEENSVCTTIGDYAFYECNSLTSVAIGDSVTSIGNSAFSYCDSLTSVTIPDSVTSIGDLAFYECNSLTSVTIGDSVTTIGQSAFYNCDSLTSVTIPDSVTSIGSSAFAYCHSLTSVTIPDSVTSIGESAFSYCDSLTSVTIPDSVTSIGDLAFAYCYSLTSVTIGDSVTSIGAFAFYYCTKLTSVTFKNPNGWAAGSTQISTGDLANTSTAATYLTSTYYYHTWTRS